MVDFEWLQKLTDPGWILVAKGYHYPPEEFRKDIRNIEDLAQDSDSYFGYSCYNPQTEKEEYDSGLIKELQREKRNLKARKISEEDSEFQTFEKKVKECYRILNNIVRFCIQLDKLKKHKPMFEKYRNDVAKLSKNLSLPKYKKKTVKLPPNPGQLFPPTGPHYKP